MNPETNDNGMSRRAFLETTTLAAAGLSLTPLAAAQVRAEPAAKTGGKSEAAAVQAVTWPLVPFASGNPRFFSDLTAGGPASAFSEEWTQDHWRVFPYETEQVKGAMIVAGQDADCVELRVSLPFEGWHAIYIGLTSYHGSSRLEAKLESDPAYALFTDHPMLRRMAYERGSNFYSTEHVQSYFWKYADLKNERLCLRPVHVLLDTEHPESRANLRHPAWVAYVKVVPMSSVETRALLADRKRTDTRRLITTHDVSTPAAYLSWFDEGAIRRELEPYRNTDFFRMDWEGGKGDLTHYPSAVGRMVTFDWRKGHYHSFERLIAQSFQTLQRKGIDPLRVALDHAHAVGLEFHASYRVSGFLYPPPRDERNRGGIFWQHPEWRGVGRNGKPTPRISYAFPEVRAWVVSLLKEMANYPIDGVTILYCRRPPVVEYEAPMVASFRQKFGLDAFALDERDPRWLSHRAEYVTAFMRETRNAMDEISERRGKGARLQVSAVVMGTEAANMYHGMDLRAWVKEKLVDWIIPYQSGDDLLSTRDSFVNPRDVAYFVNLAKGTGCRVAPNLMPRELPPRTYLERAAGLYQEGVDGLYCWDGYDRCDYSDSWSALRRLGHRDEIAAWVKAGKPALGLSQGDKFKLLGDWDMSYATPG